MILAFFVGSTVPASLVESVGMGLPQWGQLPDSMPTLAAMGCPQLGQVPIWTWGSFPASALGLKHMVEPSFLPFPGAATFISLRSVTANPPSAFPAASPMSHAPSAQFRCLQNYTKCPSVRFKIRRQIRRNQPASATPRHGAGGTTARTRAPLNASNERMARSIGRSGLSPVGNLRKALRHSCRRRPH